MNTGYLLLSSASNSWFRSLERIILVGLVVMVVLCKRLAGCHGEDRVRVENSLSVRRVRADALILKGWVGGSLR